MSKAATNATAETTAQVAAVVTPKEPTKADLARPIYKEVVAEGYQLPEGKSARAEFIRRSQEEAGLTAKGAATYWQNLGKEAKGEKPHAKKKTTVAEVPVVEGQANAAGTDAQSAAEAQAEAGQEQVEAVA